jgi:TolB protein
LGWQPGEGSNLAWSPDGRWLAFDIYSDASADEIYIMNMQTGAVRNVTNHPAYDRDPAWMP